jgi:hypothetical protein
MCVFFADNVSDQPLRAKPHASERPQVSRCSRAGSKDRKDLALAHNESRTLGRVAPVNRHQHASSRVESRAHIVSNDSASMQRFSQASSFIQFAVQHASGVAQSPTDAHVLSSRTGCMFPCATSSHEYILFAIQSAHRLHTCFSTCIGHLRKQ